MKRGKGVSLCLEQQQRKASTNITVKRHRDQPCERKSGPYFLFCSLLNGQDTQAGREVEGQAVGGSHLEKHEAASSRQEGGGESKQKKRHSSAAAHYTIATLIHLDWRGRENEGEQEGQKGICR